MTTQTPKLRFPEFSDNWEAKKLGEISYFLDGKRKPIKESDRAKMKGKYPYYGASGIIDYINDYIFDEEIILLGEDGENIISRNSPLAFRVSGKCWINNHAHVIKPKNCTNIDFLTQSLEKISFVQFNTGTAQPKLNQEVCRRITLLFPQLPEQTKIANFLTAIDEKIQALKQKKSLLEQYKKGIMQQIFSQERNAARLRFKNDDGSDFDDWEEKSLGEITLKTDKKNKDKEVLPVYSISNKNGFVHQSEQFDGVDSVERGYDTSLYKIVESGTFAYNPARINVGSIGYSGNLERVLVSSLYVCFKTINTVDNQFFSQFLETKHFNDSVNRSSEGGIRLYLFYENFSQIKINLPSLPEQQKITNFLTAIDEKIEKVSQQITATETYKKGLLQQMFI